MNYPSGPVVNYSSQHSIQAKCFHPSGTFVEFKKEEIEQSIPDRFEQMVRMYPGRLAVKTRTRELTYGELNKAANRVARTILAQRGEGEEPIALLFEQGAQLITAILGVLKAGKFYVPLDPSHPQARITSMLEDLQADLIITNDKNLCLAKEMAQNRIKAITLDELNSSATTENIGLTISPDSQAVIIYTSGSTGEPKGVIQNHRNVLHMIMRYTNALHICGLDRLSLLYSPSVSGALRVISLALLNGAGIFPFDIKEEGLGNLPNWMIQEKITMYRSVATLFRHFVDTLTGEEEFPHLRLICVGGEPIYGRDVDLYKRHFSPDCLFVHGYACSETGMILLNFIDKETQTTEGIVPAGYAVEDTEVLLQDDGGQEAGLNCVGEIAVKSRYLSPGYWRRLDLTQASFLPDPKGGGERIYHTGDLGYMLPDGCLVHLGRKDTQAKVRGYRIEVGEIEMALLRLPTIKEAIVVAREDWPGDKRLVAYFVPSKKSAATISELRSFLKKKLPDYMMPSAFVMLDALPLTPTGKVNRRALPPPGSARPQMDTRFVAPRTSVENELARIWAEVLGLDRVGIYDNFFDLGGHSLTATQVISRIRSAFRVELSSHSLFENPTVEGLVNKVAQLGGGLKIVEEVAQTLKEINQLSPDEVKTMLSEQSRL